MKELVLMLILMKSEVWSTVILKWIQKSSADCFTDASSDVNDWLADTDSDAGLVAACWFQMLVVGCAILIQMLKLIGSLILIQMLVGSLCSSNAEAGGFAILIPALNWLACCYWLECETDWSLPYFQFRCRGWLYWYWLDAEAMLTQITMHLRFQADLEADSDADADADSSEWCRSDSDADALTDSYCWWSCSHLQCSVSSWCEAAWKCDALCS